MTIATSPPAGRKVEALTVSDVAASSGAAPSAVRFYEKHGVINAARTAGNQRRFDESAACRIHVAKLAQRVGLTVREIAEMFAGLPADPQPEDWGRIAHQLVTVAEQRVADLRTRLDALGSGARLCELGAAIDS
jgi:MerR family redox-sensitive transcriptional activator SoxR